jgi:hypothetical protein
MDTTKEYIAMCEAAEEIQEHFSDISNRIGRPVYFYQYAGKGTRWETYERIGVEYDEDHVSERTKHVWLPSQDQSQDLSCAFGISCMLYEFNDFVFSNPGNRDNALRYSVRFKTVEQLWLGFIMEQNYEKHWNGSKWEKI